jgi:hypothetical protein
MSLEYIYLVPLNENALDVLNLPANKGLFGYEPNSHQPALALDLDGRQRDPAIVATIGRALTHNLILPPSRHYSRHQCSFFHNRSSRELLIEDHSSSGNTCIEYSDEALSKFEFGGPLRRRVLRTTGTIRLSFYTASFSLHVNSHHHLLNDVKTLLLNKPVAKDLEPSFLPLSLPATIKHTRVRTPQEHAHQDQAICHYRTRELGRGLFGIVFETINVVTGDHLAVKTICVKQEDLDEKTIKETVKSQIKNLQEIAHVSQSPLKLLDRTQSLILTAEHCTHLSYPGLGTGTESRNFHGPL